MNFWNLLTQTEIPLSLIYIKMKFIFFNSYVIVVEHDLSVLDYLSDFICCLYGVPGAYGVVTMPFSVREGRNFDCCFLNRSQKDRSKKYNILYSVGI